MGKQDSEKVPGAGSYHPNFSDRPKSPSYRMGTDVRRPLNETGQTPGVGTY